MVVPATALAGALSVTARSAMGVPVTVKEVVLLAPLLLVALMTTVTGLPSSGAVPVQFQVPLVLPLCVTVPLPDCTLMVTGSSMSEKVPLLETLDSSATVTSPLFDTVGG